MRSNHKQSLRMGWFRALKKGALSPISDLCYLSMELSWPTFVAWACLFFLVINLLFGTLYALIPGSLGGARSGGFANAFFFSVETFATVGYGDLYPISAAARLLATVEILCGMVLLATVTGLTFARFSRPRASIVFSDFVVLGRNDGQEALMVRIASVRC